MKIHCIAIINRHGNPIYLRNFDNYQEDVKYHYLAHTSCDVIEERLTTKASDLYLGLLQTVGDMVVYGYAMNTGNKIILVMSVPESLVRGAEIRDIFQQIHAAYIAVICNPFNEQRIEDRIESKKFDKAVAELGRIHAK
ncbi:Sedlin [Linderina pennispora]|uniref:Trafficking protein particle complex subunit 2-like protein n=1 Tax=Linderina pennispora TaxID=61395 RepID=A0A1Y1VZQ9_9FUNG|nr:Sedlin [Linderina pennispora]ORX66732.1 Sedlin [Linderina pennispora]